MSDGSHEVDPELMEEAIENTEPIIEAGKALANAAIAEVARAAGRTIEEQEERMGDRFAFTAMEQDRHQTQIVDFTGRERPMAENYPGATGGLAR